MNLDYVIEVIRSYSTKPGMHFITHEGFVVGVSTVIHMYTNSINMDMNEKITKMHLNWLVRPGNKRSNVTDSDFAKSSIREVASQYEGVYESIGEEAINFIKPLLLE